MKKLITLFEISSSEFRTKIKSLGYTEKGSELTSGGDLSSDLLNILTQLLDEWKKTNPKCPLTFTSGNDAYHKGITSYVSRHTKGEAVDVTLDKSCHPAFIALLNSYKSKYNGFSYIDEYSHPTSKATAGHFHLSYRNGAPENGAANYTSSEVAPSGPTTSGSATTDSASQTDLFGSFLDTGIKSLGFQNESKLEKNINKIKKLLK